MSYRAPYGYHYPAVPVPSLGTASSATLNEVPIEFTSAPGRKTSVVVSVDGGSQYSWGIPSHFSYSPSVHSERELVANVSSPVVHKNKQVRWDPAIPSSHSSSVRTPSLPSSLSDHVRQASAGNFTINPLLNPGRTWCDFAYPPSIDSGHKNCNPKFVEGAFDPPINRVDLTFDWNPHWVHAIVCQRALSVYDVLFEVHQFLQERESPMLTHVASPTNSRPRGSSAQAFHNSGRRIDGMGFRRVLYGLIPTGDSPNSWKVYFAEPTATPDVSS